jgi:hypothetical protein
MRILADIARQTVCLEALLVGAMGGGRVGDVMMGSLARGSAV